MNTKKRIFTKLALVFTFIILASLFFVGCGGSNGNQNNSSSEMPKEEPLVFNECLELTEATTWDNTEKKTIDELKEFARYKTITFTAKKDFSFHYFGYLSQANIMNYQYTPSVEISYRFTINTFSWYSSREIQSSTATDIGFYYSKSKNDSGYAFLSTPINRDLAETYTVEKIKVIKGQKITFTFAKTQLVTSIGNDGINATQPYKYDVLFNLHNFIFA